VKNNTAKLESIQANFCFLPSNWMLLKKNLIKFLGCYIKLKKII